MFSKIKQTYLSLKIVNLAVKKFYNIGRSLNGIFKLIKISSKGYMTHILAPRHSSEQHFAERHSTERTALTYLLLCRFLQFLTLLCLLSFCWLSFGWLQQRQNFHLIWLIGRQLNFWLISREMWSITWRVNEP